MFIELDLKPSKQKLVSFAGGMTLISLLAIPVAIYFLGEQDHQRWISIAIIGALTSALFALCKFICPTALKPPYILWMGLSVIIEMIIGPILLTIVYFGVITPTSLLSRATGKIWLNTRASDSYWKKLEPYKKESFYKQF